MPNYIRARVPGGTWFFTARLRDRKSDLLVREIGLLREAMRETRKRKPFDIDAIVILPAAIHTIWTLPAGDSDFSSRWGLFKSRFSRELPAAPDRRASDLRRGEKGIWQRRFWEHLIRDEADLADHLHLIHSAPVRAGLCRRPQDWLWTSLHRDRREGRPVPPLHRPAGYALDPAIRHAS